MGDRETLLHAYNLYKDMGLFASSETIFESFFRVINKG